MSASTPTSLAPTEVRSLQEALERTLDIVTRPRSSRALDRKHPLYGLVVNDVPGMVAAIVDDEVSYKTQGSVGRGNWAETPWVSVFDLDVTDSATRGVYVVYLIRRDGRAIYLSLNQGTTSVLRETGGNYQATLEAQARMYAGYLDDQNLLGLLQGRIDLGGGNTQLTPGYEAGNIAAISYQRGSIPNDGVLETDLMRMLTLYDALVEDINQAGTGEKDLPDGQAVTFLEARRLGNHQRAEGRNRRASKAAKDYHGYRCWVCDVDFEARLGEVGRRCIDAHHLVPFAELDERPTELNSAKDFAIVCANCHRLLHSTLPPLSIDAARELLR